MPELLDSATEGLIYQYYSQRRKMAVFGNSFACLPKIFKIFCCPPTRNL
jgi:hypothetical protein